MGYGVGFSQFPVCNQYIIIATRPRQLSSLRSLHWPLVCLLINRIATMNLIHPSIAKNTDVLANILQSHKLTHLGIGFNANYLAISLHLSCCALFGCGFSWFIEGLVVHMAPWPAACLFPHSVLEL